MIIFDVQASRNFSFTIFNGSKIHVFVYFNQTVGPCSIFPLVQVGVSDTHNCTTTALPVAGPGPDPVVDGFIILKHLILWVGQSRNISPIVIIRFKFLQLFQALLWLTTLLLPHLNVNLFISPNFSAFQIYRGVSWNIVSYSFRSSIGNTDDSLLFNSPCRAEKDARVPENVILAIVSRVHGCPLAVAVSLK